MPKVQRATSDAVPTRTRALVVGGGPAGSTAAALLAREGLDVVCLERENFPRYHVGESLVPSVLDMLDLTGAREKVEAAGFVRKPGAELRWGDEHWRLDFGELSGQNVYSFQVERDRFDTILLDHAAESGAVVRQGVEVEAIEWEDDRCSRASWTRGGERGTTEFDVLIDASGRSGLMSSRYLRNRQYHEVFQNVALWQYWEGVETSRDFAGSIRVDSIPEGWWWKIPLQDRTSVGLVIHRSEMQSRKSRPAAVYEEFLESSPVIRRMVQGAKPVSEVFAETDYSYAAGRFAGPGYYLCGDSACFLDPLLSTGVHLSMFSALLASASIVSADRGDVPEDQARRYFEHMYRQAYLRLLLMVSSFYDQNVGRRGYFWEAQRLTGKELEQHADGKAFLELLTGIEDLRASASGDLSSAMRRVGEGLRENLELRKDKDLLARQREGELGSAARRQVEANATFMDRLEGTFALSDDASFEGLRLVTEPRLGLAR